MFLNRITVNILAWISLWCEGLTCALWDVYQYPWPEYLPSFDNQKCFQTLSNVSESGRGRGQGEWGVGRRIASGSKSLIQRVLNFSSSISLLLLCVCVCVCVWFIYLPNICSGHGHLLHHIGHRIGAPAFSWETTFPQTR